MRNSMDSGFNEIKDVKARRGIREGSEEVNFSGIQNRLKLNNNEDRSNSEPPRSFGTYLPTGGGRLKPIREKNREDAQGSSDEDELSKSNSQLNESDFELEIPDSVSQTPTPTPLTSSNARRINSETNLNDTKRRMSGFMGNRSKRFCASTSELSFSSHLDTRKSLFSPKNNALSRQSFNSSLYGSNMSLSSTNSRLFMVNSPFYNGKTMFGGASAYPKRDINQHKILRTPVQMRPSSSLSNCSNTSTKSDNIVPESNAAKRILEIMNQFSGPIKEARVMGNNINSMIKIPSLVQDKKRYGENDLHLDRSIALSTPTTPYGRSIASKNRPESPSILKPLQIPTMSQLLQMKRLQNNTEKVREIASRSDSFLNQNHEYKLPSSEDGQNNSTATSLKMKSNITKNLLRNDKQSSNEPAIPVNLPNIQLPEMRGIPKFDIPMPVTTAKVVAPVVVEKPVVAPTVQFNFKASKKSEFVLSKPLPVDIDAGASLIAVSDKFKFTKPLPIDVDEEVPNKIKSPVKSTSDNLFASLVAKQKSSSWECDSCLTRNDSEKTKCLCCDTSKPDSGISSSQSLSSVSTAPKADDLFKSLAAQQKKTQWDCDSCMTKNDVSKDKCACCDAAKPGSKPAAAASAPSFSFGMPAASTGDDLFKSLAAKQKTESWECDACMTRNGVGSEKCIACESPKPGSKPAAAPAAPAPSFSFGMPAASTGDDLFKSLAAKQKTESWECDACMTRNGVGSEKCIACESPKPGSKPASAASQSFSFGAKPAAAASTFSFGMPAAKTDDGFKKIVEKQSAGWECTACMTKNDNSKTKCVCCEQSKPGTNEAAPYFSFSSSLKPSASLPLPAPSEVKFSFGVPAAAPAEKKDEVDKPKQTFSFGMPSEKAPSKTPAVEIQEPTPTPSFSFKAPSATTVSFTSKATEEKKEDKSTEKPAMFSFGATPKESPSKTITFGSDSKAPEVKKDEEKKTGFGGFKFGGEPVKAAVEPVKPVETVKAVATTFGATENKTVTTFGSLEAKTPAFGSSDAKIPAFGSSEVKSPAFGSTEVKSTPAFGSSLNKNGGFSFGGFGAKPAEPEAAKPSPGGFSFGGSSSAFGATTTASATPAPAAPAVSTNSFVFGASKNENEQPNTFGSFGMNASPATTTFGAASSGFPQTNTFSFSAKKEEPAQASGVFAFGGKPAEPTNSAPMLFGNTQSNANAVQATPVFGASTFGSSTNNNNNEFGSKMPSSFGNQPQKRAFEFTSSSADVSQNKKFDFGGQQQANSAPFQFNSGSENKPAFNFTATAAPSFNFTNPNANNPQAPTSAPVMQFGAGAPTPQIAIPGITTFSAQGPGSAAAANQRKILRARRTTRR